MRKFWTLSELKYLEENHGYKTAAEMAQHLNRSEVSIRAQLKRRGLSGRAFNKPLYWCNECSTYRTQTTRRGDCVICTRRAVLEAAIEAECCALDLTETKTRKRVTPRKRVRKYALAQPKEGATNYQKKRFLYEQARELERQDLSDINRRINTIRKRTWRTRSKCAELGVRNFSWRPYPAI